MITQDDLEKNITLDELKIGDIIFENSPVSKKSSDHVSIITSIDKPSDGKNIKIYVTHAITGKHNAVTETYLRDNALIHTHAYRLRDPNIALLAATLARNFISRSIKFSTERSASIITSTDDKLSGLSSESIQEKIQPMLAENMEAYQNYDYINVIKYALRRGNIINDLQTADKSIGLPLSKEKGFNCSGFITIIIQMAELLANFPTFPILEEVKGMIPWISDKHCDLSRFTDEYLQLLMKFNRSLDLEKAKRLIELYKKISTLKYPQKECVKSKPLLNSTLDLLFLSENINLEKLMIYLEHIKTSALLRLSPHKTSPSILQFYLSRSTVNWEYLGRFNVETISFTDDDKSLYRSIVDTRNRMRSDGLEKVSERLSSYSAGRGSPEFLSEMAQSMDSPHGQKAVEPTLSSVPTSPQFHPSLFVRSADKTLVGTSDATSTVYDTELEFTLTSKERLTC
jgi:hypothetical protein